MKEIMKESKVENNIEEIVSYLCAGASNKQTIGVELEHFIVDKELMPASYESVRQMIVKAAEKGGKLYYEGDNEIGLLTDDYAISLEPACQLEISINPKEKISEIGKIYNDFLSVWEPIVKAMGFSLLTKGVHPLVERGDAEPKDFPLIPKKRYEYMDRYFRNTGDHGAFMMRATASTQIAIDYINEADAIRKYHYANVLSPIFALITQNQSNKGRREEWDKNLLRAAIWNDTDPERCGYFEGSVNRNYSFYDYAKHIYNAPLIVGLDKQGNAFETYKSANTILQFENREFDEHILSMFFPNVRLKQYVEIRMADAMPIEKVLGYGALIKGLFYSEKALCRLRKEFSNVRNEKDIYEAEKAIMKEGYEARIYGRLGKAKKCVEYVAMLFEEAKSNLSEEEAKYLNALKSLPLIQYEYENNAFENVGEHVESAKTAKNYIMNSTAKYHNRVVRTLYFPKLFKEEDVDNFRGLVSELYGIFDKVIEEYYSNQEYRKLFGFEPELEKLILRQKTYGSNIPIARIDIFYDDATKDFKFCEFNTDGTSAMNEDRELNHAVKMTKAYKDFSEKYTLEPFELFDSWIDEFLSIYSDFHNRTGKGREIPNVAIVDFMESATTNEFEIFKERFIKRGIKCEIAEIKELKFTDGKFFTKSGMEIDAVYRRAVTSDIIANLDAVEDFIKAVESESICLIGDFRTQIVHNKILYKILYLPETFKLLTNEEIAYIKAHVPFTMSLTSKLLEDEKLKKEIFENKDRFIIKPENSYGSRGVHAGVESDAGKWKEFVLECVDDDYIIQEFCHPYRLRNIDLANDGEKAEIKTCANLTGLFVYNGKFSGCYSRISYDEMISTQYNEMALPTILVK